MLLLLGRRQKLRSQLSGRGTKVKARSTPPKSRRILTNRYPQAAF
jgi:hypothetical protein